MNETEIIKALEQVNEEYIRLKEFESPELVLGRRIYHFKESFPHVIRWISNFLRSQDCKRRSEAITEHVPPDKLVYANPPVEEGHRGVVYSCVTNGYDVPFEPIYKSKGVDYVLFTDMDPSNHVNSYWEYMSIEKTGLDQKGSLVNRYYKFHPFELFEGKYDYSIYIDGNVQTVSEISCLYTVAHESPIGIAMHRHAGRICAYKDAQWCLYNKRGQIEKLRDQIARYEEEGFPKDFGLCEGTIIVVDFSNDKARKIMKLWWDELYRSGSRRDQIAFPYVLWKNGYSIDDVGSLGNDEYHNPKFRINGHQGNLV